MPLTLSDHLMSSLLSQTWVPLSSLTVRLFPQVRTPCYSPTVCVWRRFPAPVESPLSFPLETSWAPTQATLLLFLPTSAPVAHPSLFGLSPFLPLCPHLKSSASLLSLSQSPLFITHPSPLPSFSSPCHSFKVQPPAPACSPLSSSSHCLISGHVIHPAGSWLAPF